MRSHPRSCGCDVGIDVLDRGRGPAAIAIWIEREDVLAALQYAADHVQEKIIPVDRAA